MATCYNKMLYAIMRFKELSFEAAVISIKTAKLFFSKIKIFCYAYSMLNNETLDKIGKNCPQGKPM